MKTLLSALTFALLPSALAATPVDCSRSISVGVSNLYYTSKASFPDEPQNVSLDLEEMPGGVSLCGFKFMPAEGRLTIMGGGLASFARLFQERPRASARIAIDNYYAPLEGMGSGPLSYLLFDPGTYRLTYSAPNGSKSSFALGVTVDGGPVQRLYYQGKANVIGVPKTARKVDIYVKIDKSVLSSWQRVTLDLKGSSVTLYDEAKFPTK